MKTTSHSNPSSYEWFRKQLEEESRPQRKQPPLPLLDDMTRLYVERMEKCKEADNNIKRTIEMVSGAGINPVQFILNTIRKYCPEFIETLVKATQPTTNIHFSTPTTDIKRKRNDSKKK